MAGEERLSYRTLSARRRLSPHSGRVLLILLQLLRSMSLHNYNQASPTLRNRIDQKKL